MLPILVILWQIDFQLKSYTKNKAICSHTIVIFMKEILCTVQALLHFLERKLENEINRSKYTLIKLLVSVKA